MKTLKRFLAAVLLISPLIQLSAQAPQKFNYQAVVRDQDGSIIADQDIGARVSIIKDSPGGTTVYTETHSAATNSLGLINLAIGDGTTSDDFSAVDWGNGDYYLKIEIDPAGGTNYTDMGTTQLMSVPYALYADESDPQQLVLDGNTLTISDGNMVSLPTVGTSYWTLGDGDTTLYRISGNVGIGTGLPAGKLEVQGDGDETDEDALFEVKRSDGQAVFSVYPTGVQVFVEDSEGKGAKGGFAVGGFGTGKGPTNEFLRISPDSVRIYIDEESAKGAKGGFAIGGIGKTKGTANDFMSITPENYFIGQESGASIDQGLYNSFMGYQSGTNTTNGNRNIFLGYQSGFSNRDGSTNIFIGNNAGYMNDWGNSNVFIGDSTGFNSTGWYNVFLGENSGYSSSYSHYNVFLGYESGFSNDSSVSNVFIGYKAGYENTDGDYNVFLGTLAGDKNTTGQQNVFLGQEAGYNNTEGSYNVSIGTLSGYENEGDYNTFLGYAAGNKNTTGKVNVFLGYKAGNSNTTGEFNTSIGGRAGLANESGVQNVFIGQEAGENNIDGSYNVAIGVLAGNDTIGDENVFLGWGAGQTNEGSGNIFIGANAGRGGEGQGGIVDNMLFLDNDNYTWNTTFMYGELDSWYVRFFADMVVAGDITYNESWGKSDARFKKSIKPLGSSLEKIRALEPVTFEWDAGKIEGTRFPEGKQLGLIAQEVENIFPELVKTDRQGYKAVNYNKLTVVLIEAMKEQQAMIEDLQKEVEELKAAIQQ